MPEQNVPTWLLLIHQVPGSPPYLRVKIWRRLQKLGAVAVKGSVYALPRSDDSVEDFHWVAREIIEAGGDASVCEAIFIEGITNDELVTLFNKGRESDYLELADEISAMARDLKESQKAGEQPTFAAASRVSRLRQRLKEIQAIDFFSSPAGSRTESLLADLEARIRRTSAPKGEQSIGAYSARTWVTRKGVHIDRIASSWLIRRFIDNRARFKFVAAKGYRAKPDEIRFDMFDAEFTHEGDLCTFEVLLARLGLKDRALTPIAEMIHDIDLKEDRFARPETAGFAQMINAVCTAHKDDDRRLERGAAILDDLYEFHRRR